MINYNSTDLNSGVRTPGAGRRTWYLDAGSKEKWLGDTTGSAGEYRYGIVYIYIDTYNICIYIYIYGIFMDALYILV